MRAHSGALGDAFINAVCLTICFRIFSLEKRKAKVRTFAFAWQGMGMGMGILNIIYYSTSCFSCLTYRVV